jgi:hypothetical protein
MSNHIHGKIDKNNLHTNFAEPILLWNDFQATALQVK